MSTYRELQSEYDDMPDDFGNTLMVYKIDVKNELDDRLNELHHLRAYDNWHSARYYSNMEEMIKGFMRKLVMTVLPKKLEPWWRYSYEISHKGIRLFLEHIASAWLDEQTGIVDEETVDQVFPLISLEAKMLTVDEYAKLYEVEQVTVRQWIRRGKIREAEKAGKEWRISELTDVPRRARFEQATYRWIDDLKDVPTGFEQIHDFNEVQIVKKDLNTVLKPGIEYVAFLTSRALRKTERAAIELSESQREILETYLISNPDVLFTGNTRMYSYKHRPDDAEIIDTEEED